MDTLLTVALSVFSSGVVVGLFELWIKQGIKNRFEKDLEAFKSNLKHQSELLLKEMEHKAAERNIKVAELFQRQANAIEIIHNGLFKYYGASLQYDQNRLVSVPNAQTRFSRELAETEWEEFRVGFIKNVIYLPDSTRIPIEEIVNAILDKDKYFKRMEMAGGSARADNEEVQRMDRQITITKAKIPALLDEMRQDMQAVLGMINR